VNHSNARQLLGELLHRIAPETDIDQVDPDAGLQDELDIDSMDFLNLMTALYEEAGIDVPERDYPQLATLNGCVAYVARTTGQDLRPEDTDRTPLP
jgi:acyl carrier protein